MATKFDNEISAIADTMVQSVKKTKLGRQVLSQYNHLPYEQISTAHKRDLAIVSLNQNLIELE